MKIAPKLPAHRRARSSLLRRQRQSGATLVEFSIIGSSLVILGLLTLQMGLLFHAKTVVNYATFEAARVGAVNHASLFWMRKELGYRLAPLQGGDGTPGKALKATARSELAMLDVVNTQLYILNPTKKAFNDWGVNDSVSGERVIPVNHLRHQEQAIGSESGLSLRDANILKLRVVHGVKLTVPFAGALVRGIMKRIDPENSIYYQRDRWPIQSVATVRMQSDTFESEVSNGADPIVSSAPGTLPGSPAPFPTQEIPQQSSQESTPDPVPDSPPAPVQEAGTGAPTDPGTPETALPLCEPGQYPAIAATPIVKGLQITQPELMTTQDFRELLALND